MKKNEILKLANLSIKAYNKFIKEFDCEDSDDNTIFFILLETPFLINWLTKNIKKFLPDCMRVSYYDDDKICVTDSYNYSSDYTEYDIENSLIEGKSIINYEMAKYLSGEFEEAYPDLDYRYILDLIEDEISQYYTIYHCM